MLQTILIIFICIVIVLIYLVSKDKLSVLEFFDNKQASSCPSPKLASQTCRSPVPQFGKTVKFNYNNISNSKKSKPSADSFYRSSPSPQPSNSKFQNQNAINKFPQTLISDYESRQQTQHYSQSTSQTYISQNTSNQPKKMPVFNPDYKYFDNTDNNYAPKPILKNYQPSRRNFENQIRFMNYNY